MKTLTIIDTFGFFFRLYYAMPNLKTKDGKPSGMVSGFANFIANIKKEFPSDYFVFALDSGGGTFREDIDPNYKKNRSAPPQNLKEQLPICMEMIDKMGFCSIKEKGYEADDLIASFIKNNKDEDLNIIVVTHDKDLYQLISDKVRVYSPAKKQLYDREACHEKYGVYPEQVRDFLGICGDTADNIPGVKGIGEKGAKKLLDEFGDLENIYENLSLIANQRTKNLLLESKENAFLSRKLATLYNDLETPNLEIAKFPSSNPLENIRDLLEEYSLTRVLDKLEKSAKPLSFDSRLILDFKELEEILFDMNDKVLVAFDTETSGLDAKTAKIAGFSFCLDGQKSYYVPINHSYLGAPNQISMSEASWAIEQIYKGFVIGHNLKYDFEIIRNNFGINIAKNYADTMILAWLDDPSNKVGMDELANKFFHHKTIKFEDVVKKGQIFADLDVEIASKYASEDAWITFKFYQHLNKKLDSHLLTLAKNLEFPFIKCLLEMEKNGIKMDLEALKKFINFLSEKLNILTNEIYDLTGERFNINSPKQLGEVLFDKLKLPAKKKTKTGYSTNEAVLLELKTSHPAVGKILDYREFYKLQSTYTEPLLNLALKDENNRVYSHFLQTGTATGRLSSKNPNLQNIPARGSYAKEMRNCFVSKEGYSLISLDYSQIELRLLAHFSKDPALIGAFNNDEDIHARTAISIFGDSNPPHRAIAKSINFGLIYGMGASKLASELDIERKAAKEYIEKYFEAFSTIKDFLENIKNQAKLKSYVETLLGRKRYFNFFGANPMQIAMFEREAVNTKFQGSAADIIKMAMNKILPQLNEDTKLLLQIHDELIFEVRDDLASDFAKNVKEIMENITKLNVPLKTSLSVAKQWGELK